MSNRSKAFIVGLLAKCDIEVGGSRPWDPHVHDERFYSRVVTQGSLGLGEAYMDGLWDVPELDQFLHRVLVNDLKSHIKLDLSVLGLALKERLINTQRRHVREVGEKHYDIGNDLYRRMLDPRMIYSCAYWKDASNLAQAQEAKLDLICRKIGLEPGMEVLDIGSGWGGFLKFAAERYGVRGVGITVSKEQQAFANQTMGDLPVETRLMDYMELEGKFDRIVSIGMFEHVGYKNYNRYFAKVNDLLNDDGLFLLHTIGGNVPRTSGDPWLEKYIFPHGMLPGPSQISQAAQGKLTMEDWHNFGADYDLTLMAWHENFEASWPQIKDQYGERFYRMWRYYLLSCAAVFRARWAHLWQIVYSGKGLRGGYVSVR